MAAQLTAQAGLGAPREDFPTGSIAALARAWRNHRAYRETQAELRALSVRELEDIGLVGQDIDAIARRAVYRAG